MIAVFLDTNVFLGGAKELNSNSWVLSGLEHYSDKVESLDLYQEVKFVLSEIVLQEIHRRQREEFEKQVKTLESVKLPNWQHGFTGDVVAYIEGVQKQVERHGANKSYGQVGFCVAEVPSDCLTSIISRVLKKQAPFEGKEKESDKGFKDALIWETLLDYKRKNPQESVVLVSKDKRLTSSTLKAEYQKEFKEQIEFFDGNGFGEYLETLNRQRGADAARSVIKAENVGEIEDFFKNIIFYNMEAITEAGNLSYSSDTKYRLEEFQLVNSASSYVADAATYSSILWATDSSGESSYCDIEFDCVWTDDEDSLLCHVNGETVEIEYDEVDLEAIRYGV